ncbi:DUF4241 domain-containing protein [Paenibacillus methanolicus]|uniref:Uncharacterized protein DUF4241 n=1 Tax=Paenibacillus methanolicus TaxID=582686 RepID=A0A5S5C279_9BACL|nr:DUF4241 domain-containing protein [Paenibacillus methanolicus]TYP73269.1 uncharacterized protein DUF4241 [Paenibacillus methanolicus]
MNRSYQILPFSQVKENLPKDCWAYSRNESNKGEFEEELVAYFSTDAWLDKLNLDMPFEMDNIFLILVDGNLSVHNYIYNKNTDGATGLIVKGNLTAGNMLVGGQEIYITGNLAVNELFWGDYNHGDLRVGGDVNAAIFAATDEYHVSITGTQYSKHHLSEWDEDGDWKQLDSGDIEQWLCAELYVEDEDEDEEGFRLTRGREVLDKLDSGQSLLNPLMTASVEPPQEEWGRFRERVTVEKIEEILSLPIVQEKYNDYYDLDRNGYWFGKLFFGFRLPGQGKCPRVDVGKEIVQHQGEEDFCFFHYEVLLDEQGQKYIGLSFQAGNGYEQQSEQIMPDDTDKLKKAIFYFEKLAQIVPIHNKKYIEDKNELEAIAAEKELVIQTLMNQEDLLDQTCELFGHTFRIITLKQAEQLLHELIHPGENRKLYYSILANYGSYDTDRPAYFLLMEEDAHLTHLDMEQFADCEERIGFRIEGYIFMSHLTVDQYMMAYDTDYSPPLVVFGNLQAKHIFLSGHSFYVGGNLQCECLYGFYNHGELIVSGQLEAGVVIARDFQMWINQIRSNVLIADNCIHGMTVFENEDNTYERMWTVYPSTFRSKDVLQEELVDPDHDGCWPNEQMLLKAFIDGKTVTDEAKRKQKYASFPEELSDKFQEVFGDPIFQKETSYTIAQKETANVFFYHSNGDEWKQIGYTNFIHHYGLRIVWYARQNRWQLIQDMYAEDGDLVCMFPSELEDEYAPSLAVKYWIPEAVQVFKAERRRLEQMNQPQDDLLSVLVEKENHPAIDRIVKALDLYIPTGTIVATDPVVSMERSGFKRQTPIGTFPVYLYFDHQYDRVACAELRFSEEEVHTWEMALLPEQEMKELQDGEAYGYLVDSGYGCFMDADSAKSMIQHEQLLEKQLGHDFISYYDNFLSDLLETKDGNLDYGEIVPDPQKPHNVALFSSGWGDGFYVSYFGLNKEGEVVRLVTDFGVI